MAQTAKRPKQKPRSRSAAKPTERTFHSIEEVRRVLFPKASSQAERLQDESGDFFEELPGIRHT